MNSKDFSNNLGHIFQNCLKDLFPMESIHFKLTFIIPFHPKKIASISIGHDVFMSPYHKLWTMTKMLT